MTGFQRHYLRRTPTGPTQHSNPFFRSFFPPDSPVSTSNTGPPVVKVETAEEQISTLRKQNEDMRLSMVEFEKEFRKVRDQLAQSIGANPSSNQSPQNQSSSQHQQNLHRNSRILLLNRTHFRPNLLLSLEPNPRTQHPDQVPPDLQRVQVLAVVRRAIPHQKTMQMVRRIRRIRIRHRTQETRRVTTKEKAKSVRVQGDLHSSSLLKSIRNLKMRGR